MASLLSARPERRADARPLPVTDPQQIAVPCLFMRGGSSRGGFFLEEDLPGDRQERAVVLLGAYGSPDVRQIDGIGGADPLTSKAAVVGPATVPGADVDYTFCQVEIARARVSTGGNCGNMLAAVGPFAILRGLVAATEPETAVRIYTTNTRQIVTAHVPIVDGHPAVEGECAIAGVPGCGARIRLDFGNCAGALSGKLLPTGRVCDRVEIDGRNIEVSLVDAATPFVFVRAADIGARGTERPEEILAAPALMARLEAVRGWAAQVLGLVEGPDRAAAVTPNVPRVMMVAPPAAYTATDGRAIGAPDADLCVRQMAMQRPHRALAVTGAVCTAVAAAIEGSVVQACAGGGRAELRVGHPSGVMRISASVHRAGGDYEVRSAQVERTARLILAGTLFVPRARLVELRARLET